MKIMSDHFHTAFEGPTKRDSTVYPLKGLSSGHMQEPQWPSTDSNYFDFLTKLQITKVKKRKKKWKSLESGVRLVKASFLAIFKYFLLIFVR